jgi:hypothetical protein
MPPVQPVGKGVDEAPCDVDEVLGDIIKGLNAPVPLPTAVLSIN